MLTVILLAIVIGIGLNVLGYFNPQHGVSNVNAGVNAISGAVRETREFLDWRLTRYSALVFGGALFAVLIPLYLIS